MALTTSVPVNWFEFLTLRTAFSIYAGWVTTASILNICFILKSFGIRDPNLEWKETGWAVIFLWVA